MFAPGCHFFLSKLVHAGKKKHKLILLLCTHRGVKNVVECLISNSMFHSGWKVSCFDWICYQDTFLFWRVKFEDFRRKSFFLSHYLTRLFCRFSFLVNQEGQTRRTHTHTWQYPNVSKRIKKKNQQQGNGKHQKSWTDCLGTADWIIISDLVEKHNGTENQIKWNSKVLLSW